MGNKKDPKQLAKFMAYILGRRPDEFGLIPDKDGYLKLKHVFKALSEEDGWKFVRRSHLDEILLTTPERPFEIHDSLIRATQREHLSDCLPTPADVSALPPLLYTCVRKKAYLAITGKPLQGADSLGVILSADKDMALRIGRRSDSNPIILTVQVKTCIDGGALFRKSGESLYVANMIPPEGYAGPPLSKERIEAPKAEKPRLKEDHLPGSFMLNLSGERVDKKEEGLKRRKKEITREKERKWERRHKQHRWKDE